MHKKYNCKHIRPTYNILVAVAVKYSILNWMFIGADVDFSGYLPPTGNLKDGFPPSRE